MGPAPEVAEIRAAVRTVLAALRRDTPQRAPQEGQERVLVACSGGADSLALAAATAFEAPRAGVRAGLITVDHGLQDGSAQQAASVAQLGIELGLDPVEILPVQVGTDGGPEAAARTARYTALEAAAEAFEAQVLLGHTLDDQAETVLLGLGRGSGPQSIAGMARYDGWFVRPLLQVRRTTTEAACAALGLDPWDDPHNSNPAFQRVRLRREVLPLLEDVLQGGVAEALARTAELIQDDLDVVDSLAFTEFLRLTTDGVVTPQQTLDVASIADLSRGVRTRLLRMWAAVAGVHGSLSAERTAALDALVINWHGQGPIDLPGGVTVRRSSGKLTISPATPSE